MASLLQPRNYTTSDTAKTPFSMFMVTTSGNVVIRYNNDTTTTLTSVPTNVWFPVDNAVAINATNTTASGIFVA